MTVFWIIAAGAASMLALVVSVPTLAQILSFEMPPLGSIPASLAVGMIGGGWYGVLARLNLTQIARRAA